MTRLCSLTGPTFLCLQTQEGEKLFVPLARLRTSTPLLRPFSSRTLSCESFFSESQAETCLWRSFGDVEQPEAEGGTGTGPIIGTATAMLCYWACTCTYIVFLFIPIYVSRLDDFQIKARIRTWRQLVSCLAIRRQRRAHIQQAGLHQELP